MKEKNSVNMHLKKTGCDAHWHIDEVEIVLVIRGSLEVEGYNLGKHEVKEDEMLFINKTETHRIKCVCEKTKYILLHINVFDFDSEIPNASRIFFLWDPRQTQKDSSSYIFLLKKYISYIFLELKYCNKNYEQRIKNIVKQILKLLMEEFNFIQKSIKDSNNRESIYRVWTVFEYILDNHSKKISLDELSQYVHLSPSHLSHSIKEITGVTIRDWLNAFRIEDAVRLLVSTNKSITSISYESGFSDPRYFVKYFKDSFGIAPREYRKKEMDGSYQQILDGENDYDDFDFNSKISFYLRGDKSKKHKGEIHIELFLYLLNGKNEKCLRRNLKKTLFVGNITDMNVDKELINNVQKEMGFDSITFECSIPEEVEKEYFWSVLFSWIDYFIDNNVEPRILLVDSQDEKKQSKYRAIINEMTEKRYRSERKPEWIFFDNNNITEFTYNNICDPNTFIQSIAHNNEVSICQRLLDIKSFPTSKELGLFTFNGIKNPIFFAYKLLSFLGDEVVKSGKNFIVTRNDSGFQILLWNTLEYNIVEDIESDINEEYDDIIRYALGKKMDTNISIEIEKADYILKRYTLDKKQCDYKRIASEEKILKLLTEKEIREINNNCNLNINYDYFPCCTYLNLSSELDVGNAELILIIKT